MYEVETVTNDKSPAFNYIKIINWFWDNVPHHNGYKPLYGILFFSLLDSINKNNWNATLIDFDRVLNKTRITAGPYNDGRKWLHENRLIEFTPGKNAHQMASFSIGSAIRNLTGTLITTLTPTHTGTLIDSLTGTAHSTLQLPLYNNKHINNKTINSKSVNIDFNVFWDLYEKKVGDKIRLKKKWEELTDEERKAIINYLPEYIKSTPDKKYRKNPQTFLKNKSWHDEIVAGQNSEPGKPAMQTAAKTMVI